MADTFPWTVTDLLASMGSTGSPSRVSAMAWIGSPGRGDGDRDREENVTPKGSRKTCGSRIPIAIADLAWTARSSCQDPGSTRVARSIARITARGGASACSAAAWSFPR